MFREIGLDYCRPFLAVLFTLTLISYSITLNGRYCGTLSIKKMIDS